MGIVKKNNQKGFSVVEVVIVLVVVGVLGTIGWFVYSRNSKVKPAASTASDTTQASTNSASNSSSDAGYLNVTELGVKVKLNEDTKDLTYFVNKNDIEILSSKTLAEQEPLCAANHNNSSGVNGVGSISYFTDPNATDLSPSGTDKNSVVYPDAVKVNGKYYYITTNQSGCVNNGTHNNPSDAAYQTESKLVKALRNGKVTLEKL